MVLQVTVIVLQVTVMVGSGVTSNGYGVINTCPPETTSSRAANARLQPEERMRVPIMALSGALWC